MKLLTQSSLLSLPQTLLLIRPLNPWFASAHWIPVSSLPQSFIYPGPGYLSLICGSAA